MKSILTLLLLLTVVLNIKAQSPEKMSYQAIIRAQDNTLVTNSKINLKIFLHQGSTTGTNVYQENHSVNTNNNGLVSLEIGTGISRIGNFSTIAWEKGPYFIETQVDVTGGSNYNIIGITQLLSVPYALHAKTADRLVGVNGIVATPSFKAAVNSFTTSRNINTADINNTLECTTTATLNLITGFSDMQVGDTVNLEAHNGAVLTIQAVSGVTLNYSSGGKANFTSTVGNVRFGMLRKTSTNAYIISGQ